jgi:ribose transport system substrate-binding protein
MKYHGRKVFGAAAAVAGSALVASLVVATPAFASAKGVSAAKADLAKYASLPKYVSPGPKINAKMIAKGKSVMIVPYDEAIPYNAGFAQAITAADKLAGFTNTTTYTTDGTPTSWAAGITTAISDHVAVIDLISGVAATYIKPQIQQAEAAGIVVIGSTNDDPSVPTPTWISGFIPLRYALAGQLEADYAVEKTMGHVDAVVVTSSEVPPSLSMTPKVVARLKQLDPGAVIHTVNVQPADWGNSSNGITPEVTAAINSDPKVNFVLPNYDSEAAFVIAALSAANKQGKIGIATFNGTPSAMAEVQAGTLTMNVGEDLTWAGYGTTDANLRALQHPTALGKTYNENLPYIIFTKKNAKKVGVPPNLTTGYGNAYKGYLKTWEVKK